MLLFSQPPLPPVSFSREIAPIMAMHCNKCHGESGGISTRSYREIMLGGNLGKVVVPGNPDDSLFIHFLEGRRGENLRMPKESRPLSAKQIDVIRRWITEGANDDNLPSQQYSLTVPRAPMRQGKITRVFCRVNVEAYLVLTARDPRDDRILWSEVATVKRTKERSDNAEPGQLMSWDLRSGYRWPSAVTLELSILYATSEARTTEFYARLLE